MSMRIEVPGPLHAQVAHGARFGRALDALLDEIDPEDARAWWLVGRSSEVSVFARDVMRDWCAGAIDATRAAREIEGYLHSLHRAVRRLFGERFDGACCRRGVETAVHATGLSRVRRRLDSSLSTVTQPDGWRMSLS